MTTLSFFLVFLSLSWVFEFVLAWLFLHVWWETAWFSLGLFPAGSLEMVLASVFGWAPFAVFRFLFAGIFIFYVFYALWSLVQPRLERWRLGVRVPIEEEVRLFERAFAQVTRRYSIIEPEWMIAEGPGLDMRWIGYALVIDRELLTHRYFVPLLAAQLDHADSEDRLAHRAYAMLPPIQFSIGLFLGWPVGLGHFLLYIFWMRYWRERVYVADAFAVQTGQGQSLLRALEEIYLPIDAPTWGGQILRPTPYIAARIGRIRRLLAQRQRPIRVI